jgi:hypothetical protein
MKQYNMWIMIMKMADIRSEIQSGIINYLSVNPEASASVDHICNQWLSNERYPHNIAQVQTAVDGLLARGEMHKRSDADIYTL